MLVSADLRRPTLSAIFHVEDTHKGLTSVLVGDAKLTECLRPVILPSGQKLYLLPAGPLPSNPGELLGSRGMRDVIASIEKAGADYILIDSPPVLPVADALSLAQFADGVLVLTLANRTRKGHLAETLDRLRTVNADVIGIVVNGVPTRGRSHGGLYGRYGYGGYGYGGGYTSDVTAAPTGVSTARRSSAVDTGPVPQIFDGSRTGVSVEQAPTDNGKGVETVGAPTPGDQ